MSAWTAVALKEFCHASPCPSLSDTGSPSARMSSYNASCSSWESGLRWAPSLWSCSWRISCPCHNCTHHHGVAHLHALLFYPVLVHNGVDEAVDYDCSNVVLPVTFHLLGFSSRLPYISRAGDQPRSQTASWCKSRDRLENVGQLRINAHASLYGSYLVPGFVQLLNRLQGNLLEYSRFIALEVGVVHLENARQNPYWEFASVGSPDFHRQRAILILRRALSYMTRSFSYNFIMSNLPSSLIGKLVRHVDKAPLIDHERAQVRLERRSDAFYDVRGPVLVKIGLLLFKWMASRGWNRSCCVYWLWMCRHSWMELSLRV